MSYKIVQLGIGKRFIYVGLTENSKTTYNLDKLSSDDFLRKDAKYLVSNADCR